MVLPMPEVDDRTFDELVDEALQVVREHSDGWTDLSTSDPGVVLVEAFAHLTEMMIYRMNRLPEKAYVAFLELLNVRPFPPSAAQAVLKLNLAAPRGADLELPAGLRVTTPRGGDGGRPPVFETLVPATLPAGETEVLVPAAHFVSVAGELAGRGDGQPGQSVTVRHGPLIADNLPGQNMIVAVEAEASELTAADTTVEHAGRAYSVWQEVSRFSEQTRGRNVYTVNRYTGEIAFAPALRIGEGAGRVSDRPIVLGNVPARGQEIRVWYRHEGEGGGGIPAGKLSVLVSPLDGVSVTNPEAATAGRPTEALENALARGPMELHSLERAITARDFETLACRAAAGVNRARAIANASLWAHGARGAVNVSLVPQPHDTTGLVTVQSLREAQQAQVLEQVQGVLDVRRALGTACLINWARYKSVFARANVTVYPGQDSAAAEARISERLQNLVNPLDRGPGKPGWGFGRPLLAWDVLRAIGDLPGVAGVANIRLVVDHAPHAEVKTLARDPYQADTWYTASGSEFYRSGNNGDSWEALSRFDGQTVMHVAAYAPEAGDDPARAGLVSAVTKEDDQWRLHVSRDCGESFELVSLFEFEVSSVAWIFRDRVPSLFLASPSGLFEVLLQPGAAPRQVLVDADDPEMGATSVAVSRDLQGRTIVAVAGSAEQGVYLSAEAGEAGSYRHVGLKGELVRVLMIQETATHRYLWAGVSAVGKDEGNGCYRAQLEGKGIDQDDWTHFGEGWSAGGCRALAHDGHTIYAGSLRRGVLCLNPDEAEIAWRTPDVSCGLPLRDVSRLSPVDAIAATEGFVLAAGPSGVFRSTDLGISYQCCSETEFENEVKLPANWVLCSGRHEIRVSQVDETL
ncbi:hypothetical protein DEA8626_03346 [Defluviimonas aquaemixtae]|uniref:Uncharacterized protein n=2 Tax=Albidovulum aquaemixtae TaxID=1542388 RepID=A0A2R8BLP0_9RHOB|nr:baseplate J/gp47 family protein [Defluviimonas aquaemixtae]SPH24296.1 hypothetical protein DEA8626_03346 [Defluviimonas aquaemixtae]